MATWVVVDQKDGKVKKVSYEIIAEAKNLPHCFLLRVLLFQVLLLPLIHFEFFFERGVK